MHATLRTRTNVLLIGVWSALATGAVLLTRPRPFAVLLAGAVFGVAVGALQSRSMAQTGERFRLARTAMDVRHALLATLPGKWAIRLQWIGVAVLLAAALWEGSMIGGFIAGYATLMDVREIATLGAVVRLGATTA